MLTSFFGFQCIQCLDTVLEIELRKIRYFKVICDLTISRGMYLHRQNITAPFYLKNLHEVSETKFFGTNLKMCCLNILVSQIRPTTMTHNAINSYV